MGLGDKKPVTEVGEDNEAATSDVSATTRSTLVKTLGAVTMPEGITLY